ncbi:unnamed protein product [Vitrella brassicaformis CCMP3155]|uniref:Uncharacterized protein n=1 Tax=Vitrella brassicaformis (strain CCMP3155) TaxID=1169540 RepID=A0A0G4FV26_VITBC|nr:unnamed protein product [Vitrella brassicaformis CCMP3155]|eukprot:CEM18822.1 unnamed protein product [Vitrella brassicaformis CCMP3155]
MVLARVETSEATAARRRPLLAPYRRRKVCQKFASSPREGVPFADLPAEVTPAIAACLSSYADLCAFRRIDKSRHGALMPTVLLPILQRLLPIVMASLGLGVLVEVPIPQLTQGVAVTVALTRALIEELSRRLFMLERGGSWARWKPVLEMLYLLRGKRPLVLGDDTFGVFGSRAAFMSEREAVRQWKILIWGITVTQRGQQRALMDGDKILSYSFCYQLSALLTSASPLFRHDAFDAADSPTELDGTCPNCITMVAFVVFRWLARSNHIDCIESWYAMHLRFFPPSPGWRQRRALASAASRRRRVGRLLAVSPSDAAQWGAGAAVFDEKREDGRHYRLVVFGSEAMGEGHMAVIEMHRGRDWWDCSVSIYTTESAPRHCTHTAVMRVLGDQLGARLLRRGG